MKLLTQDIHNQLLRNGRVRRDHTDAGHDEPDFMPVVKLFTPDGAATWLLSELDPDDTDIAFGLCNLGFGTPELGCVRISELKSVRGRLGLAVERDRSFRADKTLSEYADQARLTGHLSA